MKENKEYIGTSSDYLIEQSGQTTGEFSKIAELDPEQKGGGVWFGIRSGFIFKAVLVQTDGTQIPVGSELRLGVELQGKAGPKYLGRKDYDPYYYMNDQYNFGAQQNDRNQGQLAFKFNELPGFAIKEGEKFIFELKSSAQVDFTPDTGRSEMILEVEKGKGKPPKMR